MTRIRKSLLGLSAAVAVVALGIQSPASADPNVLSSYTLNEDMGSHERHYTAMRDGRLIIEHGAAPVATTISMVNGELRSRTVIAPIRGAVVDPVERAPHEFERAAWTKIFG